MRVSKEKGKEKNVCIELPALHVVSNVTNVQPRINAVVAQTVRNVENILWNNKKDKKMSCGIIIIIIISSSISIIIIIIIII